MKRLGYGALTCPRCGSKDVTPKISVDPTVGEVDLWVPVRIEYYRCDSCQHSESCRSNAKQAFIEFRDRWNDPISPSDPVEHAAQIDEVNRKEVEDARAWTWPVEDDDIHDRGWRAQWLKRLEDDREVSVWSMRDGETVIERAGPVPTNWNLMAQIIATPDADGPRAAYARWLRTQQHPFANMTADFIDGQLRIAAAFRKDPCADVKSELPEHAFSFPQNDPQGWWRHPREQWLYETTGALTRGSGVGLISDEQRFRGFVEHVAIKARRFLEIADELYSLAPIRQLTITYCKGFDHQDKGLLKALLDSPHLDRIRALELPVRQFGRDNEYTRLNVLDDEDIEQLAASQHLRGLRYLMLEDQSSLTERAYDALASSANLPELSAVVHDLHRYWFPAWFRGAHLGEEKRELEQRPLARCAAALEARYGRIPWLHVAETYGTETPDIEAVIEHPIAR